MPLGDACELSLLESIHLECGRRRHRDDKVNVVLSLPAKIEFRGAAVVPGSTIPATRLFNDAWGRRRGVHTRMSPDRRAVTIGDRGWMEFRTGQANLVEITLPDNTPWGGKPRKLQLPRMPLVTIPRHESSKPEADEPPEGGDELLFVAVTEAALSRLLLPSSNRRVLLAAGVGVEFSCTSDAAASRGRWRWAA